MVSILMFLRIRENKNLSVAESEKLSSIIFINVVDFRGVEKIVVEEQKNIENILQILKTAEMVKGKQSISDFPDRSKFTTILFRFKAGGNSWRSMYEENDVLYIDQPYDYIYKLDNDNRNLLEKIINSRNKENISLNLKEILKSDS